MKQKTSTAAIVVAIIFSIILFPLIAVGSLSSGVIFSVEELIKPNREEELYRSFADNGGVDFVYELLLEEAGAEVEELGVTPEEFFPKTQIETIVYDVYHSIIKGETYTADFSHQKEITKKIAMEQFEANIEEELRKEYGEEYDLLEESKKAQVIEEARKIFAEEIDRSVEEEFGQLEKEMTAEINSIYDLPEYQELKALEEETGYSLTDRADLCTAIRLAGYILLGFTCFLILVLLICHLFRPSGFFTAGVFTLIIGGGMTALSKSLQGILLSLISSDFAAEYSAEEFPEFIMPIIDEVLGWSMTGFEKVGKYGLTASAILILIGILLVIIRKNKTDAEPVTGMQ